MFGWIKAFDGLRPFKPRGQDSVSAVFGLHVIAYNLIRHGNGIGQTATRHFVAFRCIST